MTSKYIYENSSFIYSKINVNFIILIVAAALIVGKVVKAFFGMFKRSVDIMFLYLAYPAAIATIPLYEKSNFGTWVKQMTSKVLSLYGLLIGINLVMLLIPISMEIELFTPFDLQNTILGAIPHASARYLNILFQILFTVVGGVVGTLVGIGGTFLSMMAMAAWTMFTERKRIYATTWQRIKGLFSFPLYVLTWLPISVLAVFRKFEWVPIEHTEAISVDALEKK